MPLAGRAPRRDTPGIRTRHTGHQGATRREREGGGGRGLGAGTRGPPGTDLGQDLVAEGVDAGASGQRVGDVDV